MSNLKIILGVLGNSERLILGANLCDAAYAAGTGHADWHSPFGADKPESVAQNVAGIQAMVSGLGVIATLRGAQSPEDVDDMAKNILNDVANQQLSDLERNLLLRLANCAWGAGQAFRTDKGPLGRMTRMNIFDLLEQSEIDKDYHQIKAAAEFLLNEIKS